MTFAFASRRAQMNDQMIQSDPRLIAAMTTLPEGCRVMIPDATLRRMARPTPEMILGELSAELTAELAMILPDLAAELLAWRLMEDAADARASRRAAK